MEKQKNLIQKFYKFCISSWKLSITTVGLITIIFQAFYFSQPALYTTSVTLFSNENKLNNTQGALGFLIETSNEISRINQLKIHLYSQEFSNKLFQDTELMNDINGLYDVSLRDPFDLKNLLDEELSYQYVEGNENLIKIALTSKINRIETSIVSEIITQADSNLRTKYINASEQRIEGLKAISPGKLISKITLNNQIESEEAKLALLYTDPAYFAGIFEGPVFEEEDFQFSKLNLAIIAIFFALLLLVIQFLRDEAKKSN